MDFAFDFTDLVKWSKDLQATFRRHARVIAREISFLMWKNVVNETPIDSGELIRGWTNNNFIVQDKGTYFEVDIVNTCDYAEYVNDGHRSFNQFGGPYVVHDRVKIPLPSQYQKYPAGSPDVYVYGHFFVEKAVIKTANRRDLEAIIMTELEKWWGI